MMNIYYDENMPYVADFFGGMGQLFPFAGREVDAEQISNADVLLVRSITQVNQQLLARNPRIQFVGTATIGVDHIDQPYLASKNIAFSSAPGCNAISVAEYVISALVICGEKYQRDISELSVGIVGAGNTGTRVSEKLAALGIEYKLCDPLLERSGDERQFHSLEDVLACDVISLHVPLTREGEHATYHLLDANKLSRLKPEQWLFTACRGEVIDNNALLSMKQQGHGLTLVLDVWEGEPNVLQPLIEYTDIATAHIAGYSLEGKARGTEMLYQALCQHLEIDPTITLDKVLPAAEVSEFELTSDADSIMRNKLIKMVYDVRRDDAIFRSQLNEIGFDNIRKTYPVRREFSSLSIKAGEYNASQQLMDLGFKLK
ncbi:4-phosphoerythronate dehydrogenase [Thalassotalea agarivorans]|uniref:Erythronate-4-phosphate dehydrogenase n=1 Tax=Thalassotalea agarivorans TaxID=349064 RepID=A0A1H9ZMU1_THASX|nr:4-phosphoerythronate dehydrogenase [Thalassotalea agarivorans]SES82944.1 4-phosphoerythronate dehydrogenase [Thalassotalea agarivorans]